MTYEIKKTYRELVREDIRAQVTEAVYACIGGSPWTDDVEDGLKDLFARFDAALDGVGVIAEILDKRFEYRYPPFPPDIFDDRDAMVRNTIDLDIGDCGRSSSTTASTSTIGPPSSAGWAISGSITAATPHFRRALSTRPLAPQRQPRRHASWKTTSRSSAKGCAPWPAASKTSPSWSRPKRRPKC